MKYQIFQEIFQIFHGRNKSIHLEASFTCVILVVVRALQASTTVATRMAQHTAKTTTEKIVSRCENLEPHILEYDESRLKI